MESSDSETYDAASTIEFASKVPLKTPMCYSVNQIEILQTLGKLYFRRSFRNRRIPAKSNYTDTNA